MDEHWRNSQKVPRFFFMDARVTIFILLFLLHMRLWTLVLAVIFMILFWLLERRGLTFEAALRAFRSWVLGMRRPACSRTVRRRWVDYG